MLSQTSDCARRAIITQSIKTQPRVDIEGSNNLGNASQLSFASPSASFAPESQPGNPPSSPYKYKSVIQNMFDPKLALYGIFAHELFQEAVNSMDFTQTFLLQAAEKIIVNHIINIFALQDTEDNVRKVLTGWIPSIIRWADQYIPSAATDARNGLKQNPRQHWKYRTSLNGDDIEIGEVKYKMQAERHLDIEEHVTSIMYGLKGDIDVSLLIRLTPIRPAGQTTMAVPGGSLHPPTLPTSTKALLVPLEIKSGALSSSYASQVILYSLLMADRYNRDIPSALLFSIKECNTVVLEISRKQVMFAITHRNSFASFVHRPHLLPPLLKRAETCSNCFQVDSCMILHKTFEHGTSLGAGIPNDLFDHIVSNVTSRHHAEFLSKWFHMIDTEASEILRYRNQIWSMPQVEREKEGRCLGGMRLVSIGTKRYERSDTDVNSSVPSSHRASEPDSQSSSTVKDSQKNISTGKRQLLLVFERWPISIASHDAPTHTPKKSQLLDTVYLDASVDRTQTDCTPSARRLLLTDLQFSVGDHVVVSEGRHLGVANCSVVEVTPTSISLVCNRSSIRPPPKEQSHALPLSQRFTPLKNKLSRIQTPPKKDDIPDIESLGVTCMPTHPSSSQTDSQIAELQFRRLGSTVRWRLDRDEAQSGFSALKGNLMQLFQATQWARKFRPLFVDYAAPKFVVTPLTADEEAFLKGEPNHVVSHSMKPETRNALNSDQVGAVCKVLNARDYAIVLGMPGTGKTATIAALVSILVKRGKSVLITAGTHAAVDHLLLHCKRNGIAFLRLGQPDLVHPDIREHTLILESLQLKTVSALNEAVGPNSPQAQVVGVTCMSANHPLFQTRLFDYCIVDEASQITLPTILGPLRLANCAVLIGDLYQLPPVVKNPNAKPLSDSLFKLLAEAHPSAVHKLRVQYRMNNDIMSLSNRLIYQGQLTCGSEAVANQKLDISPQQLALLPPPLAQYAHDSSLDWMRQALDPTRSIVFLNTDFVSAPEEKVEFKDIVRNPIEANLTAQITCALLKLGVPKEHIGIISPLRAQLKQIRSNLASLGVLPTLHGVPASDWIAVHTVDRFQGSDKDCIILSLVRSNPSRIVGQLLKDWRRLNVAFTRAKKKLIIIGSRWTLSSNHLLADFFKLIDEKAWMLQLPKNAHLIYHKEDTS
jgi:hypothetical protein